MGVFVLHLKENTTVKGVKKMNDTGKSVARTGITFGSALAITISWSLHKSILWACIHGFFSWFYVIYYAFTR